MDRDANGQIQIKEDGMGESLFDLVGEYKELYAMLTDTDEDDKELVETSLETVQFEIEKKAEGYLAILERLDMEEAAAEKQKEYWTKVVNARKNGKKWMKQHIADAMMMMGVDEIQAGGKKFKLQPNGGVLPLQFVPNKEVPQNYMKITYEKDNDKIRKALESGEKLDFAYLGQRGKSVRVK